MKKSILGGIAFFLVLSFIHAQGVNKKFKTEFTSYKIDNSTCVKLYHSSGSKIFIQNNAFNLSNPIIEIKYREFTTPLDILVNNIPMTTTKNGKLYQLESGGMFEVKAFQDGKELQLLKGKKIEVQLAKSEADVKMNKMKAFQMPDSFDGWKSKSNKVKNQSIGNDDELWGSSPLSIAQELNEFDEGWSDWCEGCENEWNKQDSIRKVAFQTMQIEEMGFYNYDYIIENVNFAPIIANFKIEKEDTDATIYIVYDDINSVFYYPKYTWKNDFNIIKNKSYKMFTIDKKGNIAKLDIIPNLNTISNTNFTFNLIREQKVPQTKEELASILKL